MYCLSIYVNTSSLSLTENMLLCNFILTAGYMNLNGMVINLPWLLDTYLEDSHHCKLSAMSNV